MHKTISRVIIIIFLTILTFTINAQQLIVEGNTPQLYLTHKVAAKENFYSIGRLYNISPKEIAAYNNVSLDKGLNLGASLRIPLTPQNFSQDENDKAGNKVIPVHHIAGSGEGLFRLSTNYNKVSVETLKKWNGLTNETVQQGQPVIIGFLKANESQTTAGNNTAVEKISNEVASVIPPNVKPDAPSAPVPAVKNPDLDGNKKSETEDKTVVKNNTVTMTGLPSNSPVNFNGGLFKGLYEDQHKQKNEVNEQGVSGVFKSTSGWQDGKYYCFHNTAEPGTILKITNAANSKTIYAKVLDLLPDMKQNAGLYLLVSNAAASELGVNNIRFDCNVSYSK